MSHWVRCSRKGRVVLGWLKRDELEATQRDSCPDEDWGNFPVLGKDSEKDLKASSMPEFAIHGELRWASLACVLSDLHG